MATTGLDFLTSRLTAVAPNITKMKYPDIVFPDFMDIITRPEDQYLDKLVHLARGNTLNMNTGLVNPNTTTFESVAVSYTKIEVPIVEWRKSVGWTETELQKAMRTGEDIAEGHAEALNNEAYQTLQHVAFLGHPQDSRITGLLNNPNVNKLASGFGKPIDQMNYDEAIAAFTELFKKVVEQTGNIQNPNTIAIDNSDYSTLCLLTKPGESSLTAIQFLETSFSKIARHPVTFKAVPSTYAKSVTKNKTRIAMYFKDPGYLIWDVPRTPQFTAPVPKDGSGFYIEMYASMMFGSVCFLEPLSAMYVDY